MDAPGIPILMYHRMGSPPSGTIVPQQYCPDGLFRRQVAALRRRGYTALTLREAARLLLDGAALPTRPVVFTFDDGYQSVAELAWPVLQAVGWPATTFLVSELIGGTNEWDTVKGDATEPLMDRGQILAMQAEGHEFGSHTRRHSDLTAAGTAVHADLCESKVQLESLLGRPVESFCYPYGRWNPDVRQAVADAGFRAAVTTGKGLARAQSDPLTWPRVNVRCDTHPAVLLWKIRRAARASK